MSWLADHAPHLAAVAALLVPSPLALLKGAYRMQLPLDAIQSTLKATQGLVKMGLAIIPGGPDEDTATIVAALEPAFRTELEAHGTPPFAIDLLCRLLEFVVAAEVKAASAA